MLTVACCVAAILVALAVLAARRSPTKPAPYALWRDGDEALEEARRERLKLDRDLDDLRAPR